MTKVLKPFDKGPQKKADPKRLVQSTLFITTEYRIEFETGKGIFKEGQFRTRRNSAFNASF